MRGVKMQIIKLIRSKSYITWCFIFLFLAQFFTECYFNLFLLPKHLGFDNSWGYLKAILIWREKAFVSDIWVDQTNSFLDSSLPIASLLYGLTKNIFVAYGLSNIIVLSLIIAILFHITTKLNFRDEIVWLCLNLLICPYLLNGYGINDLVLASG